MLMRYGTVSDKITGCVVETVRPVVKRDTRATNDG